MSITREWKEEQNRTQGFTVTCPKCNGAAVEPNVHCNHCTGWGMVKPGLDATCLHEWDRGVNVGRCLNTYTCVKCGKKQTVDSSD